jgi:hypothetical protein
VPRYSILAFQFNKLLDRGQSMSIDDVQNSISDCSLFDRLAERYRGDPCRFDVGLYDAGERRTILTVFGSLSDNSDPGELGIVHNGLALCLAYCIEVMQSPETFDDYRFDE